MKPTSFILALSSLLGIVSSMPKGIAEMGLEARNSCINPIQVHEAQTFIDRNIALWKREKGWQKLAKSLYTKDFQIFSNSISSSTGTKISDQPIYKDLAEFVYALEQNIPATEEQSTVGFWIDCHELIWLRKIGKVAGSTKFETKDISVFSTQRTKTGSLQAKSALIEYDSIPWGEALGGEFTPPPAREDEKNEYD